MAVANTGPRVALRQGDRPQRLPTDPYPGWLARRKGATDRVSAPKGLPGLVSKRGIRDGPGDRDPCFKAEGRAAYLHRPRYPFASSCKVCAGRIIPASGMQTRFSSSRLIPQDPDRVPARGLQGARKCDRGPTTWRTGLRSARSTEPTQASTCSATGHSCRGADGPGMLPRRGACGRSQVYETVIVAFMLEWIVQW